jgi:hypothetical protein
MAGIRIGAEGRDQERRVGAALCSFVKESDEMRRIQIGHRVVSDDTAPLVIAEIGINHEGDPAKAKRMIDDAAQAGCE